MQDKIDSVFKKVLNLDPSKCREQIIYNEIDGWDSIAHMTLVAGLEEEFDCMLDMDDILDMSSYDKVIEIMTKYA